MEKDKSLGAILGFGNDTPATEVIASENKVAAENTTPIKTAAEVLSTLKITKTEPVEAEAKGLIAEENNLDTLIAKSGNIDKIPRVDGGIKAVSAEDAAAYINKQVEESMSDEEKGAIATIREKAKDVDPEIFLNVSDTLIKHEPKIPMSEEDNLIAGLDKLQRDSGERSTLFASEEDKQRIIADFDQCFKGYADEYGAAIKKLYDAGYVDEDGVEIPEEDRERVLEERKTREDARLAALAAGQKVDDIELNLHNGLIAESTTSSAPAVNPIKSEIRSKGVLDKNSLSKLESLKNRKRKGYNVTGLLPNSNLMIRAYPMDTAFKKQDLQESLMYAFSTYFYNMRILRMVYDHTSILANDGDTVTFEKFLEVIHLDDVDDLFVFHILAGLRGKKLKDWNVECASKEPKACGVGTDNIQLDVRSIYTEACMKSDKYMERYKMAQDRSKNMAQLVKESGIDEIHTHTYTDRGDTIKVTITRPTMNKYFSRLDKIKRAIVDLMLMDESIGNYIGSLEDWDTRPLEDQILLMAYKFKAQYEKASLKLQRFIYIDKVEIFPEEYINDITKEKDEASIITIDMEVDPVALWVEFVYDMPTDVSRKISDEVMEMSDSIKRQYRFKHVCSTCGKVTEHIDEFDPKSLFSYWIGTDTE